MEIPGDIKPDLQRTLLGPLSLATELFGALIPGLAFLILTCVKRGWATPVLTYSLVGYPTKVVLAVLSSYIIGKVSLSAIGLTFGSIEWLAIKLKSIKKKEQPPPPNANALQSLINLVFKLIKSGSWFTTFLAGLVGASILSNKAELFHHYTASQAESSFHLNMGLLLIVTSQIPGDGHFRVLEVFAGAILLAAGLKLRHENRLIMAGSYGIVMNEYLKSHSPEQVMGTLAGIAKFLAALAKVQTGSEVTPASSATTKAEEATPEVAKAASAPENTAPI